MWCPSFHISQHEELKLRTRTEKQLREPERTRGTLMWMRVKVTCKGDILYLTRSRRIMRLNKIAGSERMRKLLNLRWEKIPNVYLGKICVYNCTLHTVHTTFAMSSQRQPGLRFSLTERSGISG